jgi:methylphosphotriester-DNA--protein-cysteine methyltransferase
MLHHTNILPSVLRSKIKNKQILFAGNSKLKIYGLLNCKSGKRMKKQNRLFFVSESEAIQEGFRPCAHCMNIKYKLWKNELI